MNKFSITVENEKVTVETESITYSEFIPRILRSMEVLFGYEFDKQTVVESFAYDWFNNYSTEAYNEGFSQAIEQVNELLLSYGLHTDGNKVVQAKEHGTSGEEVRCSASDRERSSVERSELMAYTDRDSGYSDTCEQGSSSSIKAGTISVDGKENPWNHY